MKCRIFYVFSIIILLNISLILAETKQQYFVDENGNTFVSEDYKKTTQKPPSEQIKTVSKFVKDLKLPYIGDSKIVGSISIDENGGLTIDNPKLTNEQKIFIPKGYVISKDNEKWVFTGESKLFPVFNKKDPMGPEEKPLHPPLEIFGDKILSSSKETSPKTIIFEIDKNGNFAYTYKGKFEFINIGQHSYREIENGKFVVNKEKKIIFADFISTNENSYKFEHNGGLVIIKANKGGHIVFDPRNKKITGENLREFFTSKNGYTITSPKKMEIELDDNGYIRHAYIEDGEFIHSGTDSYFRATKGGFHVFFDGTDISKFQNAVSFQIENGKITMKGFIQSLRLNEHFNFEGKSTDSLVEFNINKNNFNVLSGDSSFGNFHYEVDVKNGVSSVKLKDSEKKSAASFSFAHKLQNGALLNGVFNELSDGTGTYKMSIIQDGKENIAVSKELSKIGLRSQTYLEMLSDNPSQQLKNYEQEIEELTKRISTTNDPEEKANLELKLIIVKNRADYLNNKDIKESITRIQDYMYTTDNLDLLTKAKRELAELLLEQNKQRDFHTLTTISNNYFVSSGGPYSITTPVSEEISFETNSKGEAIAYFYNGNRYEIKGSLTEIPSEMAKGNKMAIQYMIDNNDFTINGLIASGSYQSISSKIKEDETYKEAGLQAEYMRELSQQILEFGRTNKDQDSIDAGLKIIADSYALEKKPLDAIKAYDDLFNSNEASVGMKIQAKLMVARLKSMESRDMFSADEINNDFASAAKLDKKNSETLLSYNANAIRNMYGYLGLTRESIEKSDKEVGEIFGTGDGAWRYAKDSFGWYFGGYSKGILELGRGKEFFDVYTKNIDAVLEERIAASQVINLAKSGYNLRDYAQSSIQQKFEMMYNANGFNGLVSYSELREFLGKAGIDEKDEKTFTPEKLTAMENLVRQKHGDLIANEFGLNLARTSQKVLALENAMKNSPTIYRTMGMGENIDGVAYENTEVGLDKAFVQDRIGKPLEYSTSEKIVNTIGDAALNPLSYLGVGAAIKAGKLALTGMFAKDLAINIGTALSPELALAMLPKAGYDAARLIGGLAVKGIQMAGMKASRIFGKETLSEGTTISVIYGEAEKLREMKESLLKSGNYDEIADGIYRPKGSDVELVVIAKGKEDLDRLGIIPTGERRTLEDLDKQNYENLGAEAKQTSKEIDDVIKGSLPEARAQKTPEVQQTGCFLSGTRIMLGDGSYKNIEDIKDGDNVKAFDLVNNQVVDADITMTFVRKSNSYRIIEYEIEN